MCTYLCLFFFNDTATTEIYTLSLRDALPIFFTTPDGAPRENYDFSGAIEAGSFGVQLATVGNEIGRAHV